MIGDPPSEVGAVHDNDTWALPATPTTDCGAPGAVIGADGATELLGNDEDPVPMAFVAVTVKLYEVPFDRPAIVQDVDPVVEQDFDPGVEVAV